MMMQEVLQKMEQIKREEKLRYRKEKDSWKCVSACVFGAEYRFRPRELFLPKTSLYFPQGRKRCRKYLECALTDYVNDKCYKRFYLLGKGPFTKMAAGILGKLQKDDPEIEIQIWFPSVFQHLAPSRWEKRFRACRCTFEYASLPIGLTQYALMLRADMGLYFDVNPDSLVYYGRMERDADCYCVNLGLEESWKKFAPRWEG